MSDSGLVRGRKCAGLRVGRVLLSAFGAEAAIT